MIRSAMPLLMVLALGACSSGAEDANVTDLDHIETQSEMDAAIRSIPAGDFMNLDLGGRIVGPQGDQVEGRMQNAEGSFADIRSYVTCPVSMDTCDPATAPAGTIYTYVHVIYPGEDNQADTGSGTGNDSSVVETADSFRLIMPAYGFNGTAGYSKAEALAAMGPSSDVVISCDNGAIVWTVEAGDGGDQWGQAEPLTFYWQSTLPPSGTANAYEIFANHTAAQGPGPYPANDSRAPNACAAG